MARYAVFVDAGYFWVQATHVVHGAREDRGSISIDYTALRSGLLALVETQWGTDLLRVYWYDGPGPSGEKLATHRAIDELDDFKLRLGTRTGMGAQKAVDGLIIADLIMLAQTKAITHAMLLSGDADLTPGVIAGQALGLRVHLLTMGPGAATSPFLAAEVDRKCRWEDQEVRRFVSPLAIQPRARPARQPDTRQSPATTPPPADEALFADNPVQPSFDPVALAAVALRELGPTAIATIGTKATSIPGPLDKRLIAKAMEAVGRELTDDERIQLRAQVKAQARLQTPPLPISSDG